MRLGTALLLMLVFTSADAQGGQVQAKPYAKATKPHPVESRGERVFNANCSRCHTAPEQLSPSETRAVIRHMRVRASLSEADEKALLEFLAP